MPHIWAFHLYTLLLLIALPYYGEKIEVSSFIAPRHNCKKFLRFSLRFSNRNPVSKVSENTFRNYEIIEKKYRNLKTKLNLIGYYKVVLN